MLLLFLIDTWTDVTGSEALMGYQSVFAPSHASLVSAQSFFPSHKLCSLITSPWWGTGESHIQDPQNPTPSHHAWLSGVPMALEILLCLGVETSVKWPHVSSEMPGTWGY